MGPAGTDKHQSCGHQQPDKNAANLKLDNKLKEIESSFSVMLKIPNVVEDLKGNVVGSWTMVYDEGFEFTHKGYKFFAFFKYMLRKPDDNKGDPPPVESIDQYLSVCSETLIGWYHDEKLEKWGCFVAKQEDTVSNSEGRDSSDAEIATTSSLIQKYAIKKKLRKRPTKKQAKTQPIVGLLEEDGVFGSDARFIEMINSDISSSWKARQYDMFENRKVAEVFLVFLIFLLN